MRRMKGFTLIELLIVVAIIAILAAIAVPNFLEAQVRSKVSRAKADMRAMATAMESYIVDNNKRPPDMSWYWLATQSQDPFRENSNGLPDPPIISLFRLTTPVAYMTAIPKAAFEYPGKKAEVGEMPGYYQYKSDNSWKSVMYMAGTVTKWKTAGLHVEEQWTWILYSIGPDRAWSVGEYYLFGEDVLDIAATGPQDPNNPFGQATPGALYDPTNGTVSIGDICRRG